MSTHNGFWFPSMKFSEITTVLETWGLRVSEDQIQRPTGDIVQAVYLLFLLQITGITPEQLQQPMHRSLSVVGEFPDLYQNSVQHIMILHHISRIAAAARVLDFSMKDLVFPEPERTRSILSAIINFIKFCQEREGILSKLRDQSSSLLDEREKVAQQVAELKRKIAEVKDQQAKDEPRCQTLREQNAVLTNEIIEMKGAQETLVKEFNALKKTKKELSLQKENLIKEIGLVTNAIASLRSRIVQSPDRIKKYISEMNVQAQDDRSTVASIEAKTRELKTKLDALGVFEQDMKKIIDILRSVHSEHTQMDELYQRLQAFKSELDSKRILREQLFVRDDRAKRQMKNAEEKLIRAQRHAEDRKARSEDEIVRLKKEYEIMSEERRENDKQVEETKQEADEVERKTLEHLQKSEYELNELLGAYWNLRHQTDVYMETMAKKLGIEVTS